MEHLRETFENIIFQNNETPIDFDVAWEWIGYSSKQMALDMLEKNFIQGEEFSMVGLKTPSEKGGRPATHIVMTIDCFKAFCMLAQTENGKQVRRYFIQVEKEFNKEKVIREWYEANLALAMEVAEGRNSLNKKAELLRKRQALTTTEIFESVRQMKIEY